jgi:cobalamin biosynthesis protein CobW
MKIPATVITGFLGAGKTTLIRHLLANAGERRLALVINEFGDLGIDREVLLGCGIASCDDGDVVELTNGCLCCTVADDFLPTMARLLDRPRPPDHIVIETSGLALPKPLVKAFAWPEIRSRVSVDGVIAVVDAPALAAGRFADDPAAVVAAAADDPPLVHDAPLAEVFGDQVACADLIILNKIDLMDDDGLSAARAAVASALHPASRLVPAVHGRVDPVVVLGLGAGVEDDIDGRRCLHDSADDHDHDDFTSFVAEFDGAIDPDALTDRLRRAIAAHDILRVKGFLAVPGRDRRLVVQGVGPRLERYFDRPWRETEPRRSRLVVIGLRGLDSDAVRAALEP